MTAPNRMGCLMAAPEFVGVEPSTLAALAAAMREERFGAGQTVVAQGEFADRLFVLCKGEVEIIQAEIPGRVRRLGRGAMLGEFGFFAERTRTATVLAKTDCLFLSLSYTNFREFLLANPESALRLAERVVHMLQATEADLAKARQALASAGRASV